MKEKFFNVLAAVWLLAVFFLYIGWVIIPKLRGEI